MNNKIKASSDYLIFIVLWLFSACQLLSTETDKNGLITKYNEQGQKISETYYKEGKPHGIYKKWDYDHNLKGDLIIKGCFKEGKQDGIWKFWNYQYLDAKKNSYSYIEQHYNQGILVKEYRARYWLPNKEKLGESFISYDGLGNKFEKYIGYANKKIDRISNAKNGGVVHSEVFWNNGNKMMETFQTDSTSHRLEWDSLGNLTLDELYRTGVDYGLIRKVK